MKPITQLLLLTLVIGTLSSCGNDDPKEDVLPVLSVENLSIDETNEDQVVSYDILLSEAVDFDLSVDVSASEGTAVAGKDYQFSNSIEVISAGTLTHPIEFTLFGDNVPEEDEFFLITLSNPFNAELSADQSTAVITIVNDDAHEFRIPEIGYSTPDAYEGWTLVWQDEFEGTTLNQGDWTYEIGNGSNGWGNNELQYYTNRNDRIEEGNLVIEAKRESEGGFQYTSTRIITQGKQEFQYGRIDIRAAMPYGQGMWPALWMLGSSFGTTGWPACGEIDIMEMVGGETGDDETHGTVHWDDGGYASFGGSTRLEDGRLADEYHVYSIIWDETAIRWLLDDVEYHVIDITPAGLSEFHQPFFFIFNVAVGGNWPGSPDNTTVFPQWMIVDYVRVFQENE